ncbi:MAG: OmpH family outer membrane protein [Dysgonamonadaceae bacterium]|jgi:outer membrane protein|nr:OmpH family outer membrane protein [Dysgonamonadaceae bacterium]
MKNVNYIINGVLAVAIIVLFILFFTRESSSGQSDTAVVSDSSIVKLPVAYVNVDTLLNNYNYAKDLNEVLLRKSESSSAVINKKYSELEKDVMDFQMKAQNNAFLTNERMMQEESRLKKKQQDLEELASRTQNEFLAERGRVNKQLEDTIVASLKIYNEKKKYQIIFSNMGTSPMLYADDVFDITREVTDFLNKRYVPKEN